LKGAASHWREREGLNCFVVIAVALHPIRDFTVSWLGTAGHGAAWLAMELERGVRGRGNSSLLFRQPRDFTVSWLWLAKARKGGAASHISIAVIESSAFLLPIFPEFGP